MKFSKSILILLSCFILTSCSVQGTVNSALDDNKAVVVYRVKKSETTWTNKNNPEKIVNFKREYYTTSNLDQKYKVAPVTPGSYYLTRVTGYLGRTSIYPNIVGEKPIYSTVGRVVLSNREYREPYTVSVWKEAVYENRVVSYYPSVITTVMVQPGGWYDETRYKPAVNVVDAEVIMNEDASFQQAILLEFTVNSGDVVFLNPIETLVDGIVWDNNNCQIIKKGTFSCPLQKLTLGLRQYDIAEAKVAAINSKVDQAIISKMKNLHISTIAQIPQTVSESSGTFEIEFTPKVIHDFLTEAKKEENKKADAVVKDTSQIKTSLQKNLKNLKINNIIYYINTLWQIIWLGIFKGVTSL